MDIQSYDHAKEILEDIQDELGLFRLEQAVFEAHTGGKLTDRELLTIDREILDKVAQLNTGE